MRGPFGQDGRPPNPADYDPSDWGAGRRDTGRDVLWDDIDLQASRLGDALQFTPNNSVGSGLPVELRNTLAEVRTRSGLARPWTISLGLGDARFNRAVTDAGLPIVGNPARIPNTGHAFAVIKWGMRGASHRASVDWGVGVQLSVVGSYVSVDLVLPAAIGDGGTEQLPLRYDACTYHASIVPGAAAQGQGSLITRTVSLGTILATGTARGSVPAFARRWQLRNTTLVAAGAGGGLPWTFTLANQDDTAALAIWRVTNTAGRVGWDAAEWGWVVPGSSLFRVTNDDAAAAMTAASVAFQLAL